MSTDPTQIMQQPTTVQTSGPATVSGPADITPTAGGLIGQAEAALIKAPNELLYALGAVLAVILLAFCYLLVAAVSANSGTAQHYLSIIFGAGAIWAVVGVVLLGAAYVAPSPVVKP